MNNVIKLQVNEPTNEQKAITCFLSGKTGKFGGFVATANALVYREIERTRRDTLEMRQDVCAIKIETASGPSYIGNSSTLPLLNGRGQAQIQAILSGCIPMLPFQAFVEAKLDLLKARVVAQGPQEQVGVKDREYDKKKREYGDVIKPRHFIGACLFEMQGKFFLFDIDRNEIQNGIFNPFIVELPGASESIEAAYDSLKPAEVKEAERRGLKVLRQGEWFFIPVKGSYEPVKDDERGGRVLRGELRAGDNRPNYAEKFFGRVQESQNRWGRNEISVELVSGTVEHSGREHAPINLKGWYKPVPNTSVKSFTLTGDVD